jgi:hypothetical protein
MEPAKPKKTPHWLVALAWVVVAIPLGWGISTSISKALPLFQGTKDVVQKP